MSSLTAVVIIWWVTWYDLWQEDFNFVEDGIEIEPFNLNKEREEGYFDENGNFVEYARGNEMKVILIVFSEL